MTIVLHHVKALLVRNWVMLIPCNISIWRWPQLRPWDKHIIQISHQKDFQLVPERWKFNHHFIRCYFHKLDRKWNNKYLLRITATIRENYHLFLLHIYQLHLKTIEYRMYWSWQQTMTSTARSSTIQCPQAYSKLSPTRDTKWWRRFVKMVRLSLCGFWLLFFITIFVFGFGKDDIQSFHISLAFQTPPSANSIQMLRNWQYCQLTDIISTVCRCRCILRIGSWIPHISLLHPLIHLFKSDCGRPGLSVSPKLSCGDNNKLNIRWPTDAIFRAGNVVPAQLLSKLRQRIVTKGSILDIVVIGHRPPYVFYIWQYITKMLSDIVDDAYYGALWKFQSPESLVKTSQALHQELKLFVLEVL